MPDAQALPDARWLICHLTSQFSPFSAQRPRITLTDGRHPKRYIWHLSSNFVTTPTFPDCKNSTYDGCQTDATAMCPMSCDVSVPCCVHVSRPALWRMWWRSGALLPMGLAHVFRYSRHWTRHHGHITRVINCITSGHDSCALTYVLATARHPFCLFSARQRLCCGQAA